MPLERKVLKQLRKRSMHKQRLVNPELNFVSELFLRVLAAILPSKSLAAAKHLTKTLNLFGPLKQLFK